MSNSANTLLRELENERQNRRTPIQQEQLHRIEPMQPEKLTYGYWISMGLRGVFCFVWLGLIVRHCEHLIRAATDLLGGTLPNISGFISIYLLFRFVVNYNKRELEPHHVHASSPIIKIINESSMVSSSFRILNVLLLWAVPRHLIRLNLLILFIKFILDLNKLRLEKKYNVPISKFDILDIFVFLVPFTVVTFM